MPESGTIYRLMPSLRSAIYPSLIKYLGLDVKMSDRDDPQFQKDFPLHKCPAFESSDGWKLRENLALLQYLTSQAPESCTYNFWGKNPREAAKVWQWVSFGNTDCVGAMGTYIFVAKTAEEKAAALEGINKCTAELEKQLEKTTYLAGAEATIADAFLVYYFVWGMDTAFTKSWFGAHPAIERWFNDVSTTNPIVKDEIGRKKPTK